MAERRGRPSCARPPFCTSTALYRPLPPSRSWLSQPHINIHQNRGRRLEEHDPIHHRVAPDHHPHRRTLAPAAAAVARPVPDDLIVAHRLDPHYLEALPAQHLARHYDRAVLRHGIALRAVALRGESSRRQEKNCCDYCEFLDGHVPSDV